MNGVRTRLERDLTRVVEQLRRVGSGESPEAATGTTVFDEVDLVQIAQRREVGFITRERLVERAQRLHAALDRLADGTYGVCAGCGDTIHAGRLEAVPEADACVPCQEQRERTTARRRVA
jgi:DnaK suppressor protein